MGTEEGSRPLFLVSWFPFMKHLCSKMFSETLVSLCWYFFFSIPFTAHRLSQLSQRILESIILSWPGWRLVLYGPGGKFPGLSLTHMISVQRHQSCYCSCSVIVTKGEEPPKSLWTAVCLILKKLSPPNVFKSGYSVQWPKSVPSSVLGAVTSELLSLRLLITAACFTFRCLITI